MQRIFNDEWSGRMERTNGAKVGKSGQIFSGRSPFLPLDIVANRLKCWPFQENSLKKGPKFDPPPI
jgi:hypothetical protein